MCGGGNTCAQREGCDEHPVVHDGHVNKRVVRWGITVVNSITACVPSDVWCTNHVLHNQARGTKRGLRVAMGTDVGLAMELSRSACIYMASFLTTWCPVEDGNPLHTHSPAFLWICTTLSFTQGRLILGLLSLLS